MSLFTHPIVPSVESIILVSITFSHRLDRVMPLVMAKACLILENILFYIAFMEYI